MGNFKANQSARRSRVWPSVILTCICLLLGPTLVTAADAPQSNTTQNAQPAQSQPLIVSGLDEKGAGITLVGSQSRLITTSAPIHTLDVTQPDVATAKVVTPTEVMLTARRPGTSQVVVWDDNGRSQAAEVDVKPNLDLLRGALKQVAPDIEVTAIDTEVVLRGHVSSAKTAQQAAQIAAPFAKKVINLLEISGGQQVMLQVRFAEVSKSAIEALGVNFGIAGRKGFGASTIGQVEPFGITTSQAVPDTVILGVPSPGSDITAFGQFTAGSTPFDVFITAMKQNNLLRVLAEPNLTTLSGQQASFLAGGEFPYPVPQSSGAGGAGVAITIEFKQFGVRLNFTPVVLGDGRIRLQVSPEVSDLDFTHALQLNGFTIPAITTRNANTVVELNEGQTLALAGLLNVRVNATSTSVPLLGDVPILGALFRSVRYERDETELVVLVTPRIVAGMNPKQVPPMPGEHWRYPSEGELFWLRDLGGPIAQPARAPSASAPPRFQGAYGFAPVATSRLDVAR